MSGALSPRVKAVDRDEYLHTWIEARSKDTEATETVLPARHEEEGGIAAKLYTACLEVFGDLYKVLARSLFNKSTCKEQQLTLGESGSLNQLNKPLRSFATHNETVINEAAKPEERCDSQVESTDPVAPEIFSSRADGNDDEILCVDFANRDLLDSPSDGSSGTIAKLKALGKRSMKDALGILFLWGHDLMDGSLDRSLGESEELRDHVLELLCDIAKILQSRLLPLVAAQHPQEALQRRLQNLDSLLEQATLIISRDDTQTSKPSGDIEEVDFSESDVSYDGESDGEFSGVEKHYLRVNDIGKELKFHTQCLMDLLPTMEQNIALVESDHGKSLIPVAPSFSVSTPAQPYVSLLRDKYGKADEGLIERLGEANWQRHLLVRRKMDRIAERPEKEPITIFEEKATVFHDSGIGASISGPSKYAASAASHTSFISSIAEGGKGAIRVPPTPKEIIAGEPFCCNYCGLLQFGLRNRVDWKMHVFSDIRPYICTFPSCIDGLTAFPTRKSWAEHEFSKHRVDIFWVCPECQSEHPSPKALENHLDELHGHVFTRSKVSMIVGTAYRARQKPIDDQKCPLCMTTPGTTRRAFVSHLAKHMEDIALLALPRETETESDHDDDSEDDDDRKTGKQSEGFDAGKNLSLFSQFLRAKKREKCPIVTCKYHEKGFSNKSDRNSHCLIHFEGSIVCGFWPCLDSERSFSRVIMLKRHLASIHGVEEFPSSSMTHAPVTQEPITKAPDRVPDPPESSNPFHHGKAKCSICSVMFMSPQDFYDHLDDCVLQTIGMTRDSSTEPQGVTNLSDSQPTMSVTFVDIKSPKTQNELQKLFRMPRSRPRTRGEESQQERDQESGVFQLGQDQGVEGRGHGREGKENAEWKGEES